MTRSVTTGSAAPRWALGLLLGLTAPLSASQQPAPTTPAPAGPGHPPAAAPAAAAHEMRVVHPHAAAAFVPFRHSTGFFTLEHPADWAAHERGVRTNVGAEDGLVPTPTGGFRTVYGVIVQVAPDPLLGKPERSLQASAQAVVDQVLARNAHQRLTQALAPDRPLAGGPAFHATMTGVSPVTGQGERAEIVCRSLGEDRLFYLVLVTPVDHAPLVEPVLRRIRDSLTLAP